MTGMRRILLWVGLVVLLLLLIPVAAVGLLFTETGSRWVLDRVPGLTLNGYQGALLSNWHAEQLQWENEALHVRLEQPTMTLETSCLLQGTLCLRQLQVAEIDLAPEPSEESSEPATDVELPEVRLPIGIEIDEVRVGRLLLHGEPVLTDVHLAAGLSGSTLDIADVSLAYEEYRAALKGQLELAGDWPLALQLTAGGALPELGEQQVNVELGGQLQQEVELTAQLDGVLVGTLQATAQPLLAALPASVQLQLTELKLADVLPEQLAVEQLSLSAEGGLEQGFDWQLESALLASQESFALNAQGQADTVQAVVEQLRLTHATEGQVELQAQASWADDLTATARLVVEQFPWQHLAGLDEAPVQVERASLQADYAAEVYQGRLQADLQGPAGDFAVEADFSGDAGQAKVSPLLVTAGPGRVQGVVEAAWQELVSWTAELDIDQLDPAYWVADMPGELAGHLRSNGQLQDEQLSLEADLQLSGRLREQPLKAALSATGIGQHWQVPQLDILLGDNRIKGQLALDNALSGDLDIRLPAPGQLLPGAGGNVQGTLALGGTLEQPDADLQLQGRALSLDGNSVRDLKLTGQLRKGHSGELHLQARGLATAEEQLGRLELKAQGDLDRHQAQLELKGPLANARLELAGSLQQEPMVWQGELGQLEMSVENQQWQLEQPMQIDYRDGQHARLGNHCLVSEHGRLCARNEQQLLPRLKLDYLLDEFVLGSLQPWLPEAVQLDGRLKGEFRIDEQANGLQGRVLLDAGQGALVMEQDAQRFAWQTLQINSDLKPDSVTANVNLQGAEQGELSLQVSLDPRKDSKPVQGSFSLRQLDLDALHALAEDIEHLKGRIEGQGQIGGTLLEPDIRGEILLSNGHIGGGLVPVTLEDLQLAIQVAGQQATLEGGWRSGEKGQARLDGELGWNEQPSAEIRLAASDLPVFVQPYADLEVSPDLQIGYGPQGLAVTGTVLVPRGLITVPELPAGSVTVSSDAVVVGREPSEPALDMHMDVLVDVGSDRLKFRGFGLSSDVRGHLKIGDNLAGSGTLELKGGRFRGFGQRLDLRRARLVFAGPLTQPHIDIEAVRVTGDVTAGMRVTGLAEQPQAEVFSEPAMAQEQALSWLLLGKPLGGGDDGNMMAEAALGLGLMGAFPASQRVADSLGIQDFQLESEGSGNQTSVVASGQITDKLSLRYGVGIFEPGNTMGLRYQLTRKVYLDAASGLANSLDLFYRNNF